MEGWNKVSLANVGNGAAAELFEYEMGRVLENIEDPNMAGDAVRVITLTVKIKPNKERKNCAISINCDSKLAKTAAHETNMVIMKNGPETVALQQDLEQLNMEFTPDLNEVEESEASNDS